MTTNTPQDLTDGPLTNEQTNKAPQETQPNKHPANARLDIDAIRAREQAATEGPWHAWDRGIGYEVHSGDDSRCGGEPRAVWPADVPCRDLNDQFRETFTQADADFIAHARADVPALLAEVEQLRETIARVEALRDEWKLFTDRWKASLDGDGLSRSERLGLSRSYHLLQGSLGPLDHALRSEP